MTLKYIRGFQQDEKPLEIKLAITVQGQVQTSEMSVLAQASFATQLLSYKLSAQPRSPGRLPMTRTLNAGPRGSEGVEGPHPLEQDPWGYKHPQGRARAARRRPAYLLEKPHFLLQHLTLAQLADLVRATVGATGASPTVLRPPAGLTRATPLPFLSSIPGPSELRLTPSHREPGPLEAPCHYLALRKVIKAWQLRLHGQGHLKLAHDAARRGGIGARAEPPSSFLPAKATNRSFFPKTVTSLQGGG